MGCAQLWLALDDKALSLLCRLHPKRIMRLFLGGDAVGQAGEAQSCCQPSAMLPGYQ